MLESDKLSVHGLRVKPMVEMRSNWIKLGLERSPVDSLTSRFDPVFINKNIHYRPLLKRLFKMAILCYLETAVLVQK